jgi:hypothetical protein
MPRIEIFFGGPSTERSQREIESDAIKYNISLSQSLLNWFDHYFRASNRKIENGKNLYDIILSWRLSEIYGDRITSLPLSPKAICSTHAESGNKYPVIILTKDVAVYSDTNESFPLNDSIIDFLGNELEGLMELEYLGFKRKK